MSNIMQDLHTVGLNPFSVQLLAESLLKSPVALMSAKEPLKLFFPVQRGDPTEWPEDLRVQQWPGGAS